MPRMNGAVVPPKNALPLLGLTLGLFILSSRYYTSATYERPIHVAVVTLVISGVFFLLKRFCPHHHHDLDDDDHNSHQNAPTTSTRRSLKIVKPDAVAPHLPTHSNSGAGRSRIACLITAGVDHLRRLRGPFVILVTALALRSFLFWTTLRTTQCTYPGVEAFLPFCVVLCHVVGISAANLPRSKLSGTNHGIGRSTPTLAYGFVAFVWGLVAMSALDRLRVTTGTVCPLGWQWRPLMVSVQIAMCLLDAAILVSVSDIRRHEREEESDATDFFATTFITSGLVLAFISFWTLLTDSNLYWAFCPHWHDIKDLLIDSVVAAIVILSGCSLIHLVHPATLALVISSLGLFGYYMPRPGAGLLPPYSPQNAADMTAVAAAMIGFLCCLTLPPPNSSQPAATAQLHRWLAAVFITISILCMAVTALLPDGPPSIPLQQAVDQLLGAAEARSKQWANQAAASRTLDEAVAEYKRRYDMAPPPHFDKWYEFAKKHNSQVIDDFDQIHSDILPFWGIEPSVIRSRTAHLLGHASLEMGGIRVRSGTVEQTPYLSGSHRWMLNSIEQMVEPFVQWLPDMDLAINIADECRMAIPFEVMQAHKAEAHETKLRMMQNDRRSVNGTEITPQSSQWPQDFAEPLPHDVAASDFSNNIRWPLYHDLVAPSCPPSSPARRTRWWDRSVVCADCLMPHSILTDQGPLTVNSALAADLCHQPDMASLSGFLESPSAMVGTDVLYPIFSQGRAGGFSDILMPSPWNFDQKSIYEEDSGVPWTDKINGLFWRGSSSDGYAAFGSWTSFLRARFVNEAHEQRLLEMDDRNTMLSVNVSFAGGMSRCHEADCAAELATFRHWGAAVKQQGQHSHQADSDEKDLSSQITPFDEHWHYRHLIDMDGAGFSGRFLPFLQSRSLVYRAALFQAWFDERLTAWHHYIPVDVRLGAGFWAVLDWFAGSNHGPESARGPKNAQAVADQGRDWAKKALRREDMQIYMFRLLLEWGRVVDDEREELRYDGE